MGVDDGTARTESEPIRQMGWGSSRRWQSLPRTPTSPLQPSGGIGAGEGAGCRVCRSYGLWRGFQGLGQLPRGWLFDCDGWMWRKIPKGGLSGGSEPAPRIANNGTVSVRRRRSPPRPPYPCRVFKRFGRDAPAYFQGPAKQRPPLGLLGKYPTTRSPLPTLRSCLGGYGGRGLPG